MKHMIVAVVSVCLIIIYSVASTMYVSDFTNAVEAELSKMETSVYNPTEIAANIRKAYDENQSILSFIVNSEYIENLEEHLVKLEAAAEFNDYHYIEMYSNLLKVSVEDIDRQNKKII